MIIRIVETGKVNRLVRQDTVPALGCKHREDSGVARPLPIGV